VKKEVSDERLSMGDPVVAILRSAANHNTAGAFGQSLRFIA
jgi:hypothetical protein